MKNKIAKTKHYTFNLLHYDKLFFLMTKKGIMRNTVKICQKEKCDVETEKKNIIRRTCDLTSLLTKYIEIVCFFLIKKRYVTCLF